MREFAWVWPWALFLLALAPVVAGLATYGLRMRARALRRFSQGEKPRARVSPLAAGAVCALLALAAARPSWRAASPVEAEGSDVVFLVDVSKSMLARDAGRSRLETARRLALDAIERMHGERVGVAAFAGSEETVCPLTADYDFARSAIERLGPEAAERGGTDLSGAIASALETAFDDLPRKKRTLVVLSDGESLAPLRKAERDGVRVIAAGIGTESGERIPLAEGGFLKYAGREVWTKLDEDSLRKSAPEGYVDGGDAAGLARLIGAGGGARYAYEREEGAWLPLICAFVLLFSESARVRA